eukprot:4299043-Pleurochrysis_carterae.AAC.1
MLQNAILRRSRCCWRPMHLCWRSQLWPEHSLAAAEMACSYACVWAQNVMRSPRQQMEQLQLHFLD